MPEVLDHKGYSYKLVTLQRVSAGPAARAWVQAHDEPHRGEFFIGIDKLER